MLDAKHKVIGVNVVSVESLSVSIVHPCKVFKPAILLHAAAVIVGHYVTWNIRGTQSPERRHDAKRRRPCAHNALARSREMSRHSSFGSSRSWRSCDLLEFCRSRASMKRMKTMLNFFSAHTIVEVLGDQARPTIESDIS